MKVIYAREPLKDIVPSAFLAGPTPRKEYPCHSWRPEALQYLSDFNGTVLVPEDRDGTCQFDYIDQVEWEEEALTQANCILFWFARKLPEMPGLTTNTEWGVWQASGKVVVGFPPEAVKVSYQKYYAKKLNVPTFDNLKETCQAAMEMVKNVY